MRTRAKQNGKGLKLSMRHGFGLINGGMSMYLINVGIVQRLTEKLMAQSKELKTHAALLVSNTFAVS